MKEDASEQRAILAAALIQHTLTSGALDSLTTAQSDQAANLAEFDLTATSAQRQLWNSTGTGPNAFLAPNEEQQAISLQTNNGTLAGDQTTADDWYGAMTHIINFQMGAVERSLVDSITSRASSLRNQAVATALITGAIILVVLGLALFFTVVVARSMVRPLRRLRGGALEVAGVRLPETVRKMSEGEGASAPLDVEPIDVDSTDEIGEVARAFDQVHREAVRLAANEAALRGNVNAMFVNLSRRSQSLVERQIRLIDDLEQGEQDSERLANLFQMDHLATRMRRNSENLLVLAGHEVSRRWTGSVGLVDVLRAAVSEIEQYERVSLTVQPGIAVRGQAVNDVVHLLAELAENATSFSAAQTPVAVSGHLLNSGGVLLDITDQGVGMGAEEMAHANWRLDNPPVVDVAVSRRMGLFVVARLAARHGIRVRLRPASMGGLTALVWLPDEVISYETAAVPPGLRRFETASPAATDSPADPALPSPSSGAVAARAPENGHLPVLGAPPGASATS
jgi:signal transduction histidine kinase